MEIDKQYLGLIFACITAFFWGFLAIALKVAVGIIGPFNIVWFRFLVAFSILVLYFTFREPRNLRIFYKPPVLLILAAFFLGLNYLGYMQGVHLTTPGTTQIIIQLGPILLAVVGIVIYKEQVTRMQIGGFLIAGMGFILFYRDQLNNLLKNPENFNIGILYIVFGAIAWTVYASFQKRLVRDWPPQQLNLIIYFIPVIMFLPFVRLSEFHELALWQWGLMIFLGLNTLIAYGCLAIAFKYAEANKVSIIITLNPVITFIVMSVLSELEITWIEPEVISIYGFSGAFLVLAGAVLVVMRRKKGSAQKTSTLLNRKL